MFPPKKSLILFFPRFIQLFLFGSISFILLYFYGCSPAKRIIKPQLNDRTFNKTIRVFLDEFPSGSSIKPKESVYLRNSSQETIKLDKNTNIRFILTNGFVSAEAGAKTYVSSFFEVFPAAKESFIEYKGKKYRGELKYTASNNRINVINELLVEDYLKGVLPLEMGNIKGEGNTEALKAFSIIARNFAYMKLEPRSPAFDVYNDTRDQVYGGAAAEKDAANRAIEATTGMILTYQHAPAKVFYFSSCGGATEDVGNVFSQKDIPYLVSVNDSKDPCCNIAPGYIWTEKYSGKLIINRLYESKLIESADYVCKDVKINSRFGSGRVNELAVSVEKIAGGSEREIKIYSNNIRKIIKTASGAGILKSTMFDIATGNEDGEIELIIKGKGNGHGVGLCQWGAIAKSRKGESYSQILYFYFPGTRIEKIND